MLLEATSNHGSLKLTAAACVLAAAFLLHRSRWQPENEVTLNTLAGWALLPFAALLAMAGVSDVLPRAWSPSDFWAVWWAVWPPLLAASRGGRWKQGLQTCAVAGWAYAGLLLNVGDEQMDAPVAHTLTLAMMTALSLRAMTWQPEKLRRSAAWHGIALAVFGAAWTAWLGKLGGRYADGVWAQLAWLAVPMLLWTAFTAWRNHPRLQPRAVYWRWGSMAAAVFALAWLLVAN